MRVLAPLLLATGFLVGCDEGPQKAHQEHEHVMQQLTSYWVTTWGTIRNVQYANKERPYSYVVIESDEGAVYTVVLLDQVPPVWTGMYGQFAYESAGNRNGDGLWKNFQVKRHYGDVLQGGAR